MATTLIHYMGDDKQSPFRIAVGEALAEEPLRIACPYINTGYLEEIVRGKQDWKLLTDADEWLRLTGRDKRPATLDFIKEHLANIRDCSGLHAKVFIGGNGAFFGSANLTYSGLYQRDELGFQTDEPKLVYELNDWFEQLWDTKSSPVMKKLVELVQRINDTESTEKKTQHSSDSNGSSSRGGGRRLKHIPFSEEEEPRKLNPSKKIKRRIGKFQSFDELVNNFLINYPGGFNGESYQNGDRKFKHELGERFRKYLNKKHLLQLVGDEKYEEIAHIVLKKLLWYPKDSPLPSSSGNIGLFNSLKNEDNQRFFAESLFEHLYGTESLEKRFNLFADCLRYLKTKRWPIQTFFLFLSNYEENLLLKPRVTLAAIKACGYKEFYKHGDKVNWKIYSDFLEFGRYLWKKLEEYGEPFIPKDMIDIHSFIYQSVMVNQENK